MNIHSIIERYNTCSSGEKRVLKAIKSMYETGIYDERATFLIEKCKQ